MADNSQEDVILLQAITAVHKVNSEITARLKAADDQMVSFTVSPQITANSREAVSLKVVPSRLSCKVVVSRWSPSKPLQWEESSQLNVFNDNISYLIKGFPDLERLSDEILSSAEKFGMLDGLKSPPMLRQLLANMQLIQEQLIEIEDRISLELREADIQKMQQKAAELEDEINAWKASVLSWNHSHPIPHSLSFNPASVKGDLVLQEGNRSFQQTRKDHSCVSSSSPDWHSVTFTLTNQTRDGNGWIFVGVHPDPLKATINSYQEAYGWSLTLDGQHSLVYRKTDTQHFGHIWQVGDNITLSLQGNRLKVTGPQVAWEGEIGLPQAYGWHFHINSYYSDVAITSH